MEVVRYQEAYFEPLFSYWKKLSEKVPYFFPVSSEKWHECLLEDKLDNEKMLLFQETFAAVEKGEIVGFIQYGQPAFAWGKNEQKYYNPQIGIIRHFYFGEGRFDVAHLLFAKSESYLKQFSSQHAFYHNFGMSCNAHHGKLHQCLAHVDQFLCKNGYQVEHENVYYSLEINKDDRPHQHELHLISKPSGESSIQDYEICLQNNPIGTIRIRFLDKLTGGATTDIAYLTWVEIDRHFHGQGWGTKAMQLLVANLQGKKYQQLHLDTAGTNKVAQQFYERLGFQNRGRTRCYLKTTR